MNEEKIFLDKISLSAIILDKEGQLIGCYNDLLVEIKQGILGENTLASDEKALVVIRTIKDLYDILKNNKLKDLKKNDKKLESREEDIIVLISKFMDITNSERIYLKDINKAYEFLLELISLSGYHDDKVQGEGILDEEADHW